MAAAAAAALGSGARCTSWLAAGDGTARAGGSAVGGMVTAAAAALSSGARCTR
jgi:hypothetical protein